jgi:hypothetical protein
MKAASNQKSHLRAQYTGQSQATRYRVMGKQKALAVAAEGTRRLETYFQRTTDDDLVSGQVQ